MEYRIYIYLIFVQYSVQVQTSDNLEFYLEVGIEERVSIIIIIVIIIIMISCQSWDWRKGRVGGGLQYYKFLPRPLLPLKTEN